jgi:hypothetical protein
MRLCRRLGGPQGRSGRVRKISSPPEFDPRTVQPVASRYTDWATLAHTELIIIIIIIISSSINTTSDMIYCWVEYIRCKGIYCISEWRFRKVFPSVARMPGKPDRISAQYSRSAQRTTVYYTYRPQTYDAPLDTTKPEEWTKQEKFNLRASSVRRYTERKVVILNSLNSKFGTHQ